MEKVKLQEQSQRQTKKEVYEAPKAIFVPKKPEDRMDRCDTKSYRILVSCR
jgi:hypothetical protein